MTEERDPKVSQRYRDLGGEEPSRELDRSILAAARNAVDRPHAPLLAPAGRHRWYFSLAAAAVLILAVAVTIHIERQQPDAELAAPPPPAPITDERQAPKPAAKPRAKPAEPQIFAPDPQPRVEEQQPAAGQAEARSRSEAHSAGAAADSAARPMAAPAARSRVAAEAQPESPERWLERIVRLRKEGRHEEADKALAEFRQRYPAYRIPAAAEKK